MSRYVIKRLGSPFQHFWLWKLMKGKKIIMSNWSYFPTKKECIANINLVEAEMKKAKGVFVNE